MINVNKLDRELRLAGIPIDGVSDGEPTRIDFRPEATEVQRRRAQEILGAHVPEDDEDKRQRAYLEQGITPEAMIAALWERVVEGQVGATDALQAKRESVKQRIPKQGK